MIRLYPSLAAAILLSLAGPALSSAQEASEIKPSADSVLLTIFLRHTQQMNLAEMGKVLRSREWLKVFPPEGVRIVGWYMLMSVGHLVILDVPPAKIREVNRALESVAYGVFEVETRISYDFLPVIDRLRETVYKK